jgi:hypothetical protein
VQPVVVAYDARWYGGDPPVPQCRAIRHLGRVKERKRRWQKFFELQPDFGSAYVEAAYPFRDPTHTATFTEGLRKAGWSG